MELSTSEPSPGISKLIIDFKEEYEKFSKMTIPEKREALDTIYQMGTDKIPLDSVEDITITWNELPVPLRVYQNNSPEKLPIVVYFHGGGWVLGSLNSQDRLCRLIANKFACVVISVDYRLAPEHKFPAAINDGLAVLEWLTSGSSKPRWDSSKIICAGDSAGGNLSAVVSNIFNSNSSTLKILHQVLIYPVTDLSRLNTPSYLKYGQDYCLDRDEMVWYAEQYLNDTDEALNPNVSPLLQTDFSSYSPTTIITAGFDVLRDEGIEFAKKLSEKGVDTKLVNFKNMVHSFLRFAEYDDNARESIDKIVSIIGSILV
ncbi:MAG: alpha/beta hydrolase [Candidatus Kariarchaeaceae archaeon]